MDRFLIKKPLSTAVNSSNSPSTSSQTLCSRVNNPSTVNAHCSKNTSHINVNTEYEKQSVVETIDNKSENTHSNVTVSKNSKKHNSPRINKFSSKWLEMPEFKNWLGKSDNHKYSHDMAHCKICDIHLTAHKSELIRHSKSSRHINLSKQVASNYTLPHIVANTTSSDEVKRAEIKLCALLASNNLPFTLMDTLLPMCKNIFPDSKIAEKLSSGRTKSTAVIKNCLGKAFLDSLNEKLKVPGNFFSLIMDETTDQSSIKQCALTVIYYDNEVDQVTTAFFDMYELQSSTADELYTAMINNLKSKNIPLGNLVGFSSDTCNVMVGEHNSVFSRLKHDNPHIVCVKCSCHSIHLAASKACLNLPRSVEDLLRNLASHFHRSYGRQMALKECQEFFNVDIHKVLSPSITRWLSLEACVNRVLEQYDVLKAYLSTEVIDDPSITLNAMLATMNSPFTLAYLEFMSYILGVLNKFNRLFQSEVPLLHKLKPQVEELLQDCCSNFLQMKAIKKGESLLQIDHTNPRLFVELTNIYVGISASETLVSLKQDKNVSSADIDLFYKTCLNFYVELVTQVKTRFEFSDPLFSLISVIEPKVAQDFTVNTLQPLLNRFPVIKEFVDRQQVDNEWKAHAFLNYKELGLDSTKQPTEYWKDVFNLKNAAGDHMFKNLSVLIKFLLTLPFSNASVERVFSELKNCKTAHRNRLKTSTVVALMATREGVRKSNGCVNFEPTKKMLKTNPWH